MNRAILACAFALLTLGAAQSAFAQADPWLVLVSGSDIITDDNGAITCFNGTTTENSKADCNSNFGWGVTTSTGPLSGEFNLGATINGWTVTDSGISDTPSCSSQGFCMDQIEVDVTGGGTQALDSYFGSAQFANEPGVLDKQAVSINTGGFTSTGYYDMSSKVLTGLGYAEGAAPAVPGSGWNIIGSSMNFGAGDTDTQNTSSLLGSGEFALTNVMDFNAPGTYSITDTITAVPEPASFILVGGLLLAVATGLRRKLLKTV